MSKVSFEEMGAVTVSFLCEEGVSEGQVVKVSADGTVGPCTAGEDFCGVARSPRCGGAAVQVKGFVPVKTTGKLPLGWCSLAADGTGGVKKAESGGVRALVVQAEAERAVVCL